MKFIVKGRETALAKLDIVKTGIVDLHDISLPDTINKIEELSTSDKLETVITPNIDHLSRLAQQTTTSELLHIYKTASLKLCDSRILQKMLWMKLKRKIEVVPGSTLTDALFNSAMLTTKKVAVIGGERSVFDKLIIKYPHLNLYHYNPPMGFINNEQEVQKTIDFCKEIDADIYFLAVGSPRQEILSERMKESGLSGVALCVGASILFLTGDEKRAPEWIQKVHLEWFYRMMQKPQVLAKRYYQNFLWLTDIYRAI